MKKYLILLAMMLSFQTSFAQYKGQWRVIHAYELTTETRFFGMNASVEYFPKHYLSVVPSYTIFLPATGKASGLDLLARYYLTENKKQWYATGGYGYYQRRFEFNEVGKESFHFLNVGAGGMLKLNETLGLNPEIRYQVGDPGNVVFRIGVVYFIN